MMMMMMMDLQQVSQLPPRWYKGVCEELWGYCRWLHIQCGSEFNVDLLYHVVYAKIIVLHGLFCSSFFRDLRRRLVIMVVNISTALTCTGWGEWSDKDSAAFIQGPSMASQEPLSKNGARRIHCERRQSLLQLECWCNVSFFPSCLLYQPLPFCEISWSQNGDFRRWFTGYVWWCHKTTLHRSGTVSVPVMPDISQHYPSLPDLCKHWLITDFFWEWHCTHLCGQSWGNSRQSSLGSYSHSIIM